jgi:hypothetical protein
MLYLNVNDRVLSQWGRTIDLYYAIHLGNLSREIKSVNMLIEEEQGPNSDEIYLVTLSVFLKSGDVLRFSIEREQCGEAIEQCFAKAKRYIVRRIRGFIAPIQKELATLGDFGDRI